MPPPLPKEANVNSRLTAMGSLEKELSVGLRIDFSVKSMVLFTAACGQAALHLFHCKNYGLHSQSSVTALPCHLLCQRRLMLPWTCGDILQGAMPTSSQNQHKFLWLFSERWGQRSLPELYFYGAIGYAGLMTKISLFKVGRGLAPALLWTVIFYIVDYRITEYNRSQA